MVQIEMEESEKEVQNSPLASATTDSSHGGDEHPDQQEEQISRPNEDGIKEKALVEANNAKLSGNKLFGEGKYEKAILEYDRALDIAPDMPTAAELRSICHANRGVCFLKLVSLRAFREYPLTLLDLVIMEIYRKFLVIRPS